MGLMSDLGLVSLNSSSLPTFSNSHGKSWVDLCLGNDTLARLNTNCYTMDYTSTSDHAYILTTVEYHQCRKNLIIVNQTDWASFEELVKRQWDPSCLRNLDSTWKIDQAVLHLQETIKQAFFLSTRVKPKRPSAPWWNQQLSDKRKRVWKARKKYLRSMDPVSRQAHKESYLTLFREYKTMINRARTTSWKKLCTEVSNKSPWDIPFYAVFKKRKTLGIPETISTPNGYTTNPQDTYRAIFDELFPQDDPAEDSEEQHHIREYGKHYQNNIMDPPFTPQEIKKEFQQIKKRKAPRGDAIN
ncbi:uncharacterized protein LOC111637341 [Centruroides sculpturatus]|uniref:uncharacterized protein LOC111637341 n=1 Tax=Centruroides sculpturatus TaxID=218467 RepID=UPI000C6DE701|nr:uncharacterized protein LOC111637341 [Centruroides sculpturatus]